MKKIYLLLVTALLLAGSLTGCASNYNTDTDTIFVTKEGKIVLTEVEAFDETRYNKDDLLDFALKEINFYNSNQGAEVVHMDNLAVKDNVATMIMTFDTAEDYCAFTGNYIEIGTTDQMAEKGGYFSGDFVSVDKKGNADFVRTSEFLNGKPYQVVIVSGNYNVVLPNKISFLSADGGRVLNPKTILLEDGFNILDAKAQEEADTRDKKEQGNQDVEKQEEKAAEEKQPVPEGGETASASNGSISEDELLLSGAEDEVETESEQFQYVDEELSSEEKSVHINTERVYIIYK